MIKKYTLDILVFIGIYGILNTMWQLLETIFDGAIQQSKADTVIAFYITFTLWFYIRKWYIGGDIKNDL